MKRTGTEKTTIGCLGAIFGFNIIALIFICVMIGALIVAVIMAFTSGVTIGDEKYELDMFPPAIEKVEPDKE